MSNEMREQLRQADESVERICWMVKI